MKKVVEKVNTLTEDFENELYYDKEEIINEYSYDLGVEETKIEIVKLMISANEPMDKIIKYTELTEEEIIEIKNNINN